MARLTFEDYKHQIEVIKSMPSLAAMSDEISIFATSNEPQIIALFHLSDALLETYSVGESSSGETYDSIDAAYSEYTKDQIPQIIFELINYEIAEFYKEEEKSFSKDLRKTESSTTYFDPRKTFSSSFSVDELKQIEKRLIEEKCIAVHSENDFVYAFSAKLLAKAPQISWLKRYKDRTDNISLAILVHHIGTEECSKHFKGVDDKVYKLFDLPREKNDKGETTRSFYNAHRSVRNEKYKDSSSTRLIFSILEPIVT